LAWTPSYTCIAVFGQGKLENQRDAMAFMSKEKKTQEKQKVDGFCLKMLAFLAYTSYECDIRKGCRRTQSLGTIERP
jgi:hypothetical protein